MAAFETTPVHHASNGQIGQFFVSLFAGIVSWNEERKTRFALNQLTDRELEDIGLLRKDIHAIF